MFLLPLGEGYRMRENRSPIALNRNVQKKDVMCYSKQLSGILLQGYRFRIYVRFGRNE